MTGTNLLKPSGFFYVPPGLTFKNSTWCPLCVECFVRISEQTTTLALYIFNWLVFITVVESVYSAVRTDSLYRVSQKEWTKLRESVPYVKVYRYNPKHLCPNLNGYGDKGQRKVWSFCGSTYCTWFAWRNIHTLRIVRPCLQLAQARSSLRLHM